MPQVVLFGAGSIGRGFIAPLFTAVGWDVCFVDTNKERVDAINAQGTYSVFEVENEKRKEFKVRGIRAIHPDDHSALLTAISQADAMGTAVGQAALPEIAKDIAAGLAYRWQDMTKPVDLLICENGLTAAQDLRKEIKSHLPQALWPSFELDCGCVRTTIGRMIPPPENDDELNITVEPYRYLPTERAAYRAPHPAIPNLDCVDNFEAIIHQKLYIHNCTHACFAYAGLAKGYKTLPECIKDKELYDHVYAASEEIIVAMVKAHGTAQRDICRAMRDDLFKRYGNTALNDPLWRIARDPMRKLALNDRLTGAANFCITNKVNCPELCSLIREACAYKISDEEPRAEDWRLWQKEGVRSLLSNVTGLEVSDSLVYMIASSEGHP